jgi:hypothetical protein
VAPDHHTESRSRETRPEPWLGDLGFQELEAPRLAALLVRYRGDDPIVRQLSPRYRIGALLQILVALRRSKGGRSW